MFKRSMVKVCYDYGNSDRFYGDFADSTAAGILQHDLCDLQAMIMRVINVKNYPKITLF